MNIEKIINEIKQFNSDRDWYKFHTPENLVKSISIEAGELLELYQWSDDVDIYKVGQEVADILIYIFNLCDKYQLNIQQIIEMKMEINKVKYPVGKFKGNCKKYNE